jgi:hypothetical protein
MQASTDGQSNVHHELAATSDPKTIKFNLAKVSPKILKDLARFCIAIAGTIPESPSRANLRLISAKAE